MNTNELIGLMTISFSLLVFSAVAISGYVIIRISDTVNRVVDVLSSIYEQQKG